MLKTQQLCRYTQRPTNDADPGLRNPIAIFTLGVQRISEVTEAVLGPAVFVIVNALKKDRIAVIIVEEKRVPFGRNS